MPVLDNKVIQRIKEIIEKHHNYITLVMAGDKFISASEKKELKDAGVNIKNDRSILEYAYDHNFLNSIKEDKGITSVQDILDQQAEKEIIPEGEAHSVSREQLSANMAQMVDKLKIDVQSNIQNLIQDNNTKYKFNALQNLDRDEAQDELVKESTIGALKRRLRETGQDANRNWSRVAITELSNAIGLGSIDRIVNDNKGEDTDTIYVYRITKGDAAVCKYCKKFYEDTDGSPKVYRLSTILNNGSNYGKKAQDWAPTALATHPNERCSQMIELKPGWIVKPGGAVDFIGREKWQDYIRNKVKA